MPGESYTSPVTGETYTVPTYEDPADAPIAFKDFADTITGGGGIDIPATRVDAVVQTLDGSTWAEGMALSVVSEVPADSEGQVGDVVFVSGKSPAPSGAANFTNEATGTYTDADGKAYKFITFTGTDFIDIDKAGFCDLVVVGSGASGGSGYGAGGGAGAFVYIEGAYLSKKEHTVVVGAGGAAKPITNNLGSKYGSNGNASRIGDYFSPGGGAGAATADTPVAWQAMDGLSGGSGGGASASQGGTAVGGSGIIGYGGDGGDMTNPNIGAASGGGGGNPSVLGRGEQPTVWGEGGAGGEGASTNIRNTTIYLCGGGGGCGTTIGGAGGNNIGGAGSISGVASAGSGVAGTGSGGGGLYSTDAGSIAGSGGSGIVIVRVEI